MKYPNWETQDGPVRWVYKDKPKASLHAVCLAWRMTSVFICAPTLPSSPTQLAKQLPTLPPHSFPKHEDSLRKSEFNLSSRTLFAYS